MGTSMALIFLVLTEIIAIFTITLITWIAIKNNNIVGGIEGLIYWLVRFVLSQIFILPITWIIYKLHNLSR
jgi:hypothetical protein